MLHQLEQHSINRRRMNKRHQTTTGACAWRFVDEARPFIFQVSEGCVDVLNLNRNVMHSRPAVGEELPYSRLRVKRFQQLDVSVANCQHAYLDALLGDFLCRVHFQAKCVSPDCQAIFDAVGGYSDVINFEQPR